MAETMSVIATAFIVAPKGATVRDKPLPKSLGGKELYAIPCGGPIDIFAVLTVDTVQYAKVKTGWIRVEEADGTGKILQINSPGPTGTEILAAAIEHLAAAVEKLSKK